MESFINVLLIYLGTVNLFTFLLYGWDKLNAETHSYRVPEKRLWFLTLIGGSVGAITGMNVFRHKTRKISFQFVVALILLLHAAIVFWIVRENFGGGIGLT